MRWAAENLREFVKRNYKDKAIPWWREYSGVIGTAALIMVFTVAMGVILYMMRGVVTDIGSFAGTMESALETVTNACTSHPGSGVAPT